LSPSTAAKNPTVFMRLARRLFMESLLGPECESQKLEKHVLDD
jgi:hypothetical protein